MPAPTTIYTDSKADCDAFALLFKNTCADSETELADNVALLAGTEKSCTFTGPECVDSGERASDTNKDCTYTRKVCARCEEDVDTGGVRFKIQSNGLPLNCFYGFR